MESSQSHSLNQSRRSSISSSVGSQSSLLNREAMAAWGMNALRASTVKVQQKEVTAWTSVIIEKNFPLQVKATKLEYMTNAFLNNQQFPQLPADLQGGLILQMPLTQIKEYLDGKIEVEQLMSDD